MILPLRGPHQLSQGGSLHRALRTRRGGPRARVKKDSSPTLVGPAQGVVWWTFVPAKRNVVNVDLKTPSTLWLFSPHHESLDPIPSIPPPLRLTRTASPVGSRNGPTGGIPSAPNSQHTKVLRTHLDLYFSFFHDGPPVRVYPGYHVQRPRLRRCWIILR